MVKNLTEEMIFSSVTKLKEWKSQKYIGNSDSIDFNSNLIALNQNKFTNFGIAFKQNPEVVNVVLDDR